MAYMVIFVLRMCARDLLTCVFDNDKLDISECR